MNHEDVSISGKIFDLLSTHMYDGEDKAAWPEHLHNFLSTIHVENEFSDKYAGSLLAYTLPESPFHWVLNLLADIVHSFKHLCYLIEDTFYHFDLDHVD